MKKVLQNKQIDFLLSFIGFIFSAVLLIYGLISFLMEQSEKAEVAEGLSLRGQSSSLKYESNEQVFFRVGLIAVCFLFSALISRFTKKNIVRLINFVFLTIILIQSYVLSNDGFLGIEYGKTQYTENGEYRLIILGLAILGYIGCFMMLPAILIMIIQIRRLLKEKQSSHLPL